MEYVLYPCTFDREGFEVNGEGELNDNDADDVCEFVCGVCEHVYQQPGSPWSAHDLAAFIEKIAAKGVK